MPQPKRYDNDAQRQAEYRQRSRTEHLAQLAARSLPPLPPVPTMPGDRRWSALIKLANWALETAHEEMQNYFDERSEAWQEGARAEALQERISLLEQALEACAEL